MTTRNPFPVLRSPVRVALSSVWRTPESHDMRFWLSFDTAPIAVVRQYASDIGLGAYTRVFGEAAERRLAAAGYRLYELRDKQGFVDAWMGFINSAYVHTFYRDAGGVIIGLDICLSAPPGITLPADYLTETLRALRWGLPWFAALPVTGANTGLVVTTCAVETAQFQLTTGAYARTIFDAAA